MTSAALPPGERTPASGAVDQLPTLTPEQRRLTTGQFDRASQLMATGNEVHAIHLLMDCCRRDPGNLLYRQALRRAEKSRYRNNMRGAWLGWLRTWPARTRLRAALQADRPLEVLDLAERVLVRNPWDVPAQTALAQAALALGLLDLAIWALEQARQKDPADPGLIRTLAGLYERRGNFSQALALWERLHAIAPDDHGVGLKLRGLAGRIASEVGSSALPQLREEAARVQAVIDADPMNPDSYRQLSRLYREAGQFDDAHAVLLSGMGPTGNAFELTVELAALQIEPFRRDLALTEEKLAQSPQDEELTRIRQQLLKEINTRELDLHRLLAGRFPQEVSHRYEVGLRLIRGGQLEEAIVEMHSVREDPKLRWRALVSLACCHQARNNVRQALRYLEEALNHVPNEELTCRKDILYELARGHADAGQVERAVELADQLYRLDPGHRDLPALHQVWRQRLQQARAS